MGRAKRDWVAKLVRGYNNAADKYVCSKCFDDYAIREFINENAVKRVCDYCGNEASEAISTPLEEVIGFILEGIKTEWDDPANCVGWEEGWVGAEVIDSDELIRYRVGLEDCGEELLQNIVAAIFDREWCQRDPYGMRTEEALTFSWFDFVEQVKHHTRYIFFRLDNEEQHFYDIDKIPASKMLDRISWVISELNSEIGIISVLKPGSEIFRVRPHSKDKEYNTAKELGPPLPEDAKSSNRMSPAGIPMFYGSFDRETALKERIAGEIEPGTVATIATFKTLRNMKVLNLTELPEVPSLFDPNNRHMRSSLRFMHSFVSDLSKPVIKDNLEHIEYVPTQIFTEYLRYLYTDDEREFLNGIIYPSAANPNGVSCVLFLENKHCCDQYQDTMDDRDSETRYLFLERVERRLLRRQNTPS